MKQLLIRSRREKEASSGRNISFEEVLNLYNHLIHDVEIASTSKEAKRKAEKWEAEDKKTKRGDPKRVNPRSFLTKNKNKKTGVIKVPKYRIFFLVVKFVFEFFS